MSQLKFPHILSPSIGCPLFVSIDQPESSIQVILASQRIPVEGWSLTPSSSNRDSTLPEIDLIVSTKFKPRILDPDAKLQFENFEDTRRYISQELQNKVLAKLGDYTLYEIHLTFKHPPGKNVLRDTETHRDLQTLYDLKLGDSCVKNHAIALYSQQKNDMKFIHLTDLHLARRNDKILDEITAEIGPLEKFNNFNENARYFIKVANEKSDRGELDLILIGGDVIDFVNQGFSNEPFQSDNNWKFAIEIFTGSKSELSSGNEGLRVPIFTTTGNHDWRFNPYDIDPLKDIFALNKKQSTSFKSNYYDSDKTINQKLEEVYLKIIRDGSPLLKEGLWNKLGKLLLRLLEKPAIKASGAFSIYAVFYGLLHPGMNVVGPEQIQQFHLKDSGDVIALLLTGFSVGLLYVLKGLYGKFMRKVIREGVIPIEAKVSALYDYFLHMNPYFNYAFAYGNAGFILMDTGPDCFVGQAFWDNGNEKMKNLSIKDNILGGSPDTMGFYPINEFYSYGQIHWLEQVLTLFSSNDEGPEKKIFICLHSPPINLKNIPVIPEGENEKLISHDIRFGTINHFLSQFFALCLGKKEGDPGYQKQKVDVVFCGHAHQNVEFRMEEQQKLRIYCGEYSKSVTPSSFEKMKPFVVQSAACGPLKKGYLNPPYFRDVHISEQNEIQSFRSVDRNEV